MDKFAVDLDQVLNDFEYSELTDQYSNTARNPIDASSSVQHNVTKHSINNVFHSLNEYLNTSVDIPSENNITTVEEEKVIGDTEPCYTINTQEKEINESDVRDCDNTILVKDKNINVETVVIADQLNTTNNVISLEKYNEPKKQELEEENCIQIADMENQSVPEEDAKEDILIDFDNSTNISEEFSVEPNEDLNKEDVKDITNSDIQEIKEKSDIKHEELVDIQESDKNEEVEDSILDQTVDIVGFETVTDVHEDEVEELLAELEEDNQEESQIMVEQQTEIKEEDIQEIKIEDTDTKSTIEEKVDTEEPTYEPDAASEPEQLEKEDIKTEDPIVEESYSDIEASTKKLDNTSDIQINKEISTIEDTAVEDSVAEEETAKSIEVEDSSNKEKEEVKTETENKEIKLERQDSASRPQHLPLKEEESEKQREINLIGNPGSTPYNNVYVNEEINKKDRDTESISSTSSNSFSDSGSTASTASTEEIRDDNDEVNPNTKETIPTENIARDNVEVSDNNASEGNTVDETSGGEDRLPASSNNPERDWLGKEAPLWIPDSNTTSCLHCDMKFTVLKRRHHCRACGLVLCSKCCHLRFKLEYLDAEARVCNKCHNILNKDTNSSSSSDISPDHGSFRRPNPNNPLEYCSTISPLQQVGVATGNPVPAVMVPVGVLKRKGSNKAKSNKSVMFCDGIRPGSDLTNLDNDFNYSNTKTKKLEKNSTTAGKINRNLPIIDSDTNSFIPKSENSLPPLITITKSDITYTDCQNNPSTVEMLKENQLTFALLLNLYVQLKIINMNCCINKMAWCFSTEGLINVGQDEVVIILEYIEDESFVPKDVFYHINNIYTDAVKGTSIKELGISLHNTSNFLDSKNHAGFVFIRPTFQCLENVIKPKEPYLIGILIHRWETPWAKLFPLRLILRLGAEYRYYPSPVISTRHRDSVFVEIGHTIINLLADFRNFSYTLPQINGLNIHMEDKNTTVTIPINRYDQIIKSINNSSDHILAFGGSFSEIADSHLVCIQDTQGNENCYSTHAINIQNKPRKITGASFIVFNGALKSSSGLTAKSNIVEDGLMIQILPETLQQIRDNLRAMKNHTISCGCVNAESDETVNIVWGENDVNFNLGITSAIDGMALNGVPSIRVHSGQNYCANGNRIIRWTEVFIIQNDDDSRKNQDPIDISRLSEGIAKAVCDALVNYLDLLVTNSFHKIAIRTNLHVDNVSYCGGSNNMKLPPIYMKSLDNELIPVLHRLTSNNLGENCIILELIFRILNV